MIFLEMIVVAAIVILLGYVLFVRIRMQDKNDAFTRNEKNDGGQQHGYGSTTVDGEPDPAAASGTATNKTGRKAAASSTNNATTNVKKQRTTEANYQHPWLYTTLKGHTRQVLDVDFSRNGKYLATCAEDSPSTQSSGNNHLINGSINENDEQNASTRSLSPALSSSSSSSTFSGVSDGKMTNVVTSSCSGSGDGSNSTTSGSTSCSSSGSTHGEDSSNTHGASKKQRKYTKKKQYKKNAGNINCNNGSGNTSTTSSNLRQTSSSSSIASDDAANALHDDDHVKHTKYYYNSSPPINSSSLTSSNPATKSHLATRSQIGSNNQRNAISSANALWPSLPTPPSIATAETSLSSSIKNDNKHASYQGRLAFSNRINTTASKAGHRLDKKYHKGNATSSSVAVGGQATATNVSPLRQYVKLNLNENELVKYLRKYVLDKDVMKELGFPVEYGLDSNKAIIYKFPHDFFRPSQLYPASTTVATDTKKDLTHVAGVDKSDDNDSGQGSGTSSPTNVDNNDSLLMYRLSSDSTSLESPLSPDVQLQPSEERECCRCGKGFFITRDGEYLTQEHCIFHWGRLTRVFNGVEFKKIYSCCNGEIDVKGCTINKLHVWTGLLSGFNGPFDGFVKTQPSPRKLKKFGKMLLSKFYYQNISADCTDIEQEDLEDDESDGVFSLDCEMSYTGRGLELTKVTVVSADGGLVYEKLVKPDIEIVDYNTRYSGVTEAHFANASNYVTLRQVQEDLCQFIYDDTILIGHAIENDLKVLKIIHKTVIDTSITFPHMNGFPFRQSLKTLTKNILKRDIQMHMSIASGSVHSKSPHLFKAELLCAGSSIISSNNSSNCDSHNGSSNSSYSYGHCSLEDSRASLELMLWRVRKDKVAFDNIWNSCYRMQNN